MQLMSESEAQISDNVPQYSVSELSGAIKQALESRFGRVKVHGEVTELKRYPSGHIYLSLKDEGGKIAAVIWRGVAGRLGLTPENGMDVVATGRVSAYGERSSYQLMIDQLSFAGEGALLARIEQIRVKLLQEGLFDPDRKKPLPYFPARIGVITSSQGAVLHDICTTIERRFPRDVLIWPVAVQGQGAVEQILAALAGIVAAEPDIVILARGGGSLEDLMAFNDERVVRAVAAFPLPLISAIGHETDTTLVDYAADRRAPTPTAAAEMAVPQRSEMLADLAHRAARLLSAGNLVLQRAAARRDRAVSFMPDLPALLETSRLRLDDRTQRLSFALPSFVQKLRARHDRVQSLLTSPQTSIAARRQTVYEAQGRLRDCLNLSVFKARRGFVSLPDQTRIIQATLVLKRSVFDGVSRQLEAMSPHAVLARGYVLVQDGAGRPVSSAHDHPQGGAVTLTFADGERKGHIQADAGRAIPQGDLGL